jgi:hypothetical protein
MGRLPIYGKSCHVWEVFRSIGESSHVWEDLPCIGSLPMYGKSSEV